MWGGGWKCHQTPEVDYIMERWVMGEGGEAARTSCHVSNSLTRRSSSRSPFTTHRYCGFTTMLPSTQSPAVASHGFACSLPLPSQHSPLTSAAQSHWSTAQICSNTYWNSHCVITKVSILSSTQGLSYIACNPPNRFDPFPTQNNSGFSFRSTAQLTASQVRLAPHSTVSHSFSLLRTSLPSPRLPTNICKAPSRN